MPSRMAGMKSEIDGRARTASKKLKCYPCVLSSCVHYEHAHLQVQYRYRIVSSYALLFVCNIQMKLQQMFRALQYKRRFLLLLQNAVKEFSLINVA